MQQARRTFIVANLPGWILAAVLGWLAVRYLDLLPWIAILLVAVWVVKDFAFYPVTRRYYRSESARRRILGEEGVALTPVNPRGFVRVHGEIWQAEVRAGAGALEEGAAVRVRGIDGLLLTVEGHTPP